jgi:hypothetical protein
MSLVTDILDRLSGVSALKRVVAQDKIIEQMQRLGPVHAIFVAALCTQGAGCKAQARSNA